MALTHTGNDVVNTKKSLVWGASLCAHAVEGANFDADWWRWEQRPDRIAGGATSERAAEHLHRYAEDLDIARKLGCTTLQTGISWARIEPERGRYDDTALTHYEAVFKAMTQKGIGPVCVLQEHALPNWFSEMGAWEHPDAGRFFVDFAAVVLDVLGPYCEYWLPHFEPLLWLGMTYGEKRWPRPQGGRSRWRALEGMTKAHRGVWKHFKEKDGKHQIGLSLYAPNFYPSDRHSPWDEKIREQTTKLFHQHYPTLLGATEEAPTPSFDFMAVTLPGELGVRMAPWRMGNGWAQFERPSQKKCALDEAMAGGSPIEVLARAFGCGEVPLLLTGMGCATDDDVVRCHHLLDTCEAVFQLQKEGVNIMGLCYRSLLDGFEWHHGFQQRWGLIHVDRKSQARTPNQSAFLYQDIIRSGSIHPGAVSRFAPNWQTARREVS